MDTKGKRYHVLISIYQLWKIVKNLALPGFLLFVININSDKPIMVYGRYAMILFLSVKVVHIFLEWFSNTYQLDEHSFYINTGVFNKSQQTIPFSKIQNISRHTSLFHKLFGLTSIRFETSMTGDDSAVNFEVISKNEADRLEALVAKPTTLISALSVEENNEVEDSHAFEKNKAANRTIHFRPTRKELIKASFTSLSFLVLIPILFSFYDTIQDLFNVEKKAKGVFVELIETGWILTIVIIVLVIVSIGFGIMRTFLKYGNYEISSDNERIYIKKGIIDETAFSISKERVQAIEITQSPIKRILGLAEVKLTSAGDIVESEDSQDINSLYPFLPIKSAIEMVSEILPSYQVLEQMERLPRKSFLVRLLRPSWLWIIATAVFFLIDPSFLGEGRTWWIISVVLLVLILIYRIFQVKNTMYALNDKFIQFKKGGFTTTLFVSRRDKIIEVEVSRNSMQKLLGLASIGTVNRAKPVHHTGIDDIPQEIAAQFYNWYIGRSRDIQIK